MLPTRKSSFENLPLEDSNYPFKFNLYTKMAKPQVDHIKGVLDKFFDGLIDMSDYKKKSPAETKTAFYSRSLGAYYLNVMADLSPDEAAKCVTDGYNDNGIDAIYYDEQTSVLYIIQSKLLNEGNGEPENGEMLKFSQGISDVIDGKFGKNFNDKVKKKEPEIKDALNDRNIKLNIVLAYTGKGFSVHNQTVIDNLMEKLNDTIQWAHFTDWNLKAIHGTLNAATAYKPIEQELTLSNWGAIEDPYKTYYGQVSAYALAQIYSTHGKRLFDANIRSFIGLSSINSGILDTVKNEPENFIYLNNGVMLICQDVEPIPGKTINKATGSFHCTGMQIVNGAQTVGSLGNAMSKFEEQLKKCLVFVRLIPLNQCPDDFGNKITLASNTQNRIEKRDFVSLDPIQHSLKLNFALAGITYHYKRTEDAVTFDDKNCSLEEATVALACYQDNVQNCVLAKREIGRLWDDIKLPPYTDLFNDKLKHTTLWNLIRIYREVMKYLNQHKDEKTGREKSTYTLGNYFILHLMFCLMPKNQYLSPTKVEAYLKSKDFSTLLASVVKTCYDQGEASYPTSLIHQLYRNLTKCEEMKTNILIKLRKKDKINLFYVVTRCIFVSWIEITKRLTSTSE